MEHEGPRQRRRRSLQLPLNFGRRLDCRRLARILRRTHHGCISSPARIARISIQSPAKVAMTIAMTRRLEPEAVAGQQRRTDSWPRPGHAPVVPETGMSKISPWVKFHAAWMPDRQPQAAASAYRPRRAAPRLRARSRTAAIGDALGLKRCAAPKNAEVSSSAAQLPPNSSIQRNRIPRNRISSVTAGNSAGTSSAASRPLDRRWPTMR